MEMARAKIIFAIEIYDFLPGNIAVDVYSTEIENCITDTLILKTNYWFSIYAYNASHIALCLSVLFLEQFRVVFLRIKSDVKLA